MARLVADPPIIGENEGFTPEKDLFKLAPFGERMANLVCAMEHPFVVALDGPWGSGKTVFAQQWSGLMRQRGAPVIQFDAFANDFQEDGFLALAAEINAFAEEKLGKSRKATKKFIGAAKGVGKILLKAGIRAGTAGLVSAADFEDADEKIQKAISEAARGAVDAATEKLVDDRLSRAREDREVMSAFRATLEELARSLSEKSLTEKTELEGDESEVSPPSIPPLVIIIDEMDRCRPPFALSLLERIKHLFSVPGVVFVLVTHLPQLAAAVRGTYGNDVKAEVYLEKFIQLRLTLAREDERVGAGDRFATERYIQHLWQKQGLKLRDNNDSRDLQKLLIILATVNETSLRTLERIVTTVSLAVAATGPRQLFLTPIISGLAFMRVLRPELFDKARDGTLRWTEAKAFLQMERWFDEEHKARYTSLNWRYLCGESLQPDELKMLDNLRFDYHLDDPISTLRFFARQISDLHQVEGVV